MAKGVDYNPIYFKDVFLEYFEMPWKTYYLKMKMRAAARFILHKRSSLNAPKQFGYSDTRSYNKAFINEIGAKPAEFLANDLPVPDMPDRKQLCGIPIHLSVVNEKIPGIDEMPPYAVLSAERTGDDLEDSVVMRMLQKYAFKEWAYINRIEINRMGKVQKRYDDNRLWLYIPLMGEQKELMHWKTSLQGALYREYIDSHIADVIRTEEFAEKIHYSERGLKDAFELLYGIEPDKYIESKRLSMAFEELQERAGGKEEIAKKYQFQSMGHFGKLFYNRYGAYYKDYKKPEEEPPVIPTDNITVHYGKCRQIRISFVDLPKMWAAVYPVKYIPDNLRAEDLLAIVAHWFTHDSEYGDRGNTPGIKEITDKIFLYDIHMYDPERELGGCFPLGILFPDDKETVCDKGIRESVLPLGFKEKVLMGGRYLRFEMGDEYGPEELMEMYRQMEASVFFRWYYNNQNLINGKREMFIRYTGKQLYAYLPLRA